MRVSRVHTLILFSSALVLPACDAGERQPQGDARRQPQGDARMITVAVVQSKSATLEQSYPCLIDSARPVFVHSPVKGRVAAILVKEGQAVKQGDPLFEIGLPRDGKKPEAEDRDKVVSIKAPCDGLVRGFLGPGPGDPVGKGTHVLTLGDDGVMRVHFDISGKHYLELVTERGLDWRNADLHLILADRSNYPHVGKIVDFLAGRSDKGAGYIRVATEFPNPDGVLHRGQTGTLSIKRVVKDAILLIPRRATFEGPYLWKRYVYVVDKDHVAHRREIVIEDGADDVSVVKEGVSVGERIIVGGVGQVHDGDKVE
jgi:membrane fusion protein, multidrug efflux system